MGATAAIGRGGREDFGFSKCEIPSFYGYNDTADWINRHWVSPAFRNDHLMCIFAHWGASTVWEPRAQILLNNLWNAQKKPGHLFK